MAETRPSRFDFFREVVEQVKKVTWPDRKQIQESTGIILVFMFAVAGVIWLMDLGVTVVLQVVRDLVG